MFRLLSFISSLILILFEINGKKFLVKTGDEELETEYEDFEMEDEDVEIDIKNDIERYFLQISPINATKLIPNWSKVGEKVVQINFIIVGSKLSISFQNSFIFLPHLDSESKLCSDKNQIGL